ncbi:MAG: hypothetical protein PHF53_10765, partial [Bacteroidales bacterium]|nr:hypothetical protein [Bacteroidales bacterium]
VYRDKNKSTALNKDNHQSNHDNIQEEDIPKNSKSLLSTKASNQELLEWLKSRAKNERIVKFRIKQFANRLKGEIYIINNGKIKITEKLKGRLTASRIMILTSETILENHHNFGTYLFNVTNNSKLIKGTRSALCIECGNATSGMYCLLEKE